MSGAAVVCIVGWLAGWWAFGRPRRVADLAPGTAARERITVVVPARDEAHAIGDLLDDLLTPTAAAVGSGVGPDVGSDLEIVVVDDHSTDGTAAIARARQGVHVVTADDLPAGWTGKNWACHSGTAAATDLATDADAGPADRLVFVDADVRFRPGSLDLVLDEQERVGGLLSVQPWHDAGRGVEQLSALFNVLAVMGSACGTGRDVDLAFGPVMVTSAEDLRQVGGHAAVSGEVVEDLALARRYRDGDLPCRTLLGQGGVTYRMYPLGFRQLVEGWTKNFATGAGAIGLPRLVATVAWVAALGTPVMALASGELGIVAGVVLYALTTLQLRVMFHRVGRFGWITALVHPVLVLTFLGVFFRSAWLTHVRRVVRWRGRDIPVGTGS